MEEFTEGVTLGSNTWIARDEWGWWKLSPYLDAQDVSPPPAPHIKAWWSLFSTNSQFFRPYQIYHCSAGRSIFLRLRFSLWSGFFPSCLQGPYSTISFLTVVCIFSFWLSLLSIQTCSPIPRSTFTLDPTLIMVLSFFLQGKLDFSRYVPYILTSLS